MSDRSVSLPTGVKVVLLAAVAAISMTAGCSSGEPADDASSPAADRTTRRSVTPTPTPSTTSPSAAEAAGRKAVAAYLAMWQDFVVAGTTSDWDSPRLADHASGDALLAMSRGLYADHYNGLVSKGKPTNSPTVSSVTPASMPKTVMISDCGDSSRWLTYKADTGELADDEPGGRRKITAEVKLHQDGSWRVTRFAVEAVGTC